MEGGDKWIEMKGKKKKGKERKERNRRNRKGKKKQKMKRKVKKKERKTSRTDVPSNKITPDYLKTVEMVYLGVVEFCPTREGHQPDFLDHAVRTSPNFFHLKDDCEPLKASWIPDWRSHINVSPFPKVMKCQDPAAIGEESESAVIQRR